MAVEVGGQAPDFELRDQHGTPVRLSSFRGAKHVVLVFYPLAFSGVCTGELCSLRDEFPEVDRDDVELLTVSVDSTFAHQGLGRRRAFPVRSAVGLLAARRGGQAVRCVPTPNAVSRSGGRSSSTRTASCGGRSSTRPRRRAISPNTRKRSPRSASAAVRGGLGDCRVTAAACGRRTRSGGRAPGAGGCCATSLSWSARRARSQASGPPSSSPAPGAPART